MLRFSLQDGAIGRERRPGVSETGLEILTFVRRQWEPRTISPSTVGYHRGVLSQLLANGFRCRPVLWVMGPTIFAQVAKRPLHIGIHRTVGRPIRADPRNDAFHNRQIEFLFKVRKLVARQFLRLPMMKLCSDVC